MKVYCVWYEEHYNDEYMSAYKGLALMSRSLSTAKSYVKDRLNEIYDGLKTEFEEWKNRASMGDEAFEEVYGDDYDLKLLSANELPEDTKEYEYFNDTHSTESYAITEMEVVD
jgi:hypothetical protein